MLSTKAIRIGVSVIATVALSLGTGLVGVGAASAATSPKLTVAPATGLKNGESVTAKGSAGCSVVGIPTPITISSKGVFPATKFKVITGKIGTGTCGTKSSNLSSCDLSVGNATGGDSATSPIAFKSKK
jgi:hypothetical protein